MAFSRRLSGGNLGAAQSPAMVTAEAEVPARTRPARLALRFLTGGLLSAAVTCFVVAPVIGRWSVAGLGAGLVAVVYVAAVISELRNSAGDGTQDKPPEPVTCTALAKIESRRATGGDAGDVPVEFDLTVQPDDGPAYRVTVSHTVNLVDIPDYRPGGTVVVDYRSDRLWRVGIVTAPTPQWVRRAAEAAIDSAPESTRLTGPGLGQGFASCAVVGAGILAGAAVVVVLFRADLF
jgi:hypothetical protein